MADATSVSYRKGTNTEHDVFHGVKGEITVDTTNSTVWVHMGDEKKGTPLARADFKNLDQSALTNAKIANNSLENVFLPNDEVAMRVRRDNLGRLHYAYDDMSNIDTATLANPRGHAGKDLAYKDLSNVEDGAIATAIGDTTFLKYDMSNVRTALLTNANTLPVGQDPLAYSDLRNVDTADLATTGHGHSGNNLAYANLSNIAGINRTDLHTAGFQIIDKLVALNSATTADQYPTALSVQTAINEKATLPGLPTTAQVEKLFLCNGYPYSHEVTLASGGAGYVVNETLTVSDINVKVDSVDGSGAILTCTQLSFFGTTDKTASGVTQSATTGSGSGATFDIISQSTGTTGLLWDTGIDSSTITFTNTYEISGTTYYYVTINPAIGPIYTMDDAIRSLGLNQQSHVGNTSNPHSTTISNLTDTTITTPASNEALVYDGTKWVNKELIAWATYGTTTYQNIVDWATAGKEVLCSYTGTETIIFRLLKITSTFCSFSGVNVNGEISVLKVTNANQWSTEQFFAQSQIPAGVAGQVVTYSGTAGSVGAATLSAAGASGNYNDLTNKPNFVRDISVNDTTGVISVTLALSSTTDPTIKFLIGGSAVSGTWNGSGASRTFTPTNPDDILLDSWIINI